MRTTIGRCCVCACDASSARTGEPVDSRHQEIEHNDVGELAIKLLERLKASTRFRHVVSGEGEMLTQQTSQRFIVFHEEDLGAPRHAVKDRTRVCAGSISTWRLCG